jgi:hypothetical protein
MKKEKDIFIRALPERNSISVEANTPAGCVFMKHFYGKASILLTCSVVNDLLTDLHKNHLSFKFQLRGSK